MYRLLCFILLYVLVSCQGHPDRNVAVRGRPALLKTISPEKIKGMYLGELKGSPLSVVVENVTSGQASGYNLHQGIRRNLQGIVEFSDGSLYLFLVEPGDSRYDGQFQLVVDTLSWKGKGIWKSFVTGKSIPFSFRKREITSADGAQTFVDALSNFLVLKQNGTCTYHYLPDSTKTTERIVDGRYKKEKNNLTIHWQPNKLFRSGKSVFHLIAQQAYPGENYVQHSLRANGHVLNEMIFD